MNRILEGGTDLLLGGSQPLSVVAVGITVIATILLVILVVYMAKNLPSTLFGQIAFIIGALVGLSLAFFVGMRGLSMAAGGIL